MLRYHFGDAMFPLLFGILLGLLQTANTTAQLQVQRREFFVASDPGTKIFLREVFAGSANQTRMAIVLVHGARVPGVASFDLPVAGGSLAADLAVRGLDVSDL
jgi:hypothetical protein